MFSKTRPWHRRLPPQLRLAGTVAAAAPGYSGLLGVLLLSAAVLPAAVAVTVGSLVTAVLEADRTSPESLFSAVLPLFCAIVVLVLLQQTLPPFQETVGELLGARSMASLGGRVMRATMAPSGIDHLARTSVRERLASARHFAPTDYAPLFAVPALATVAGTTLAALVSAAVLFAFTWWVPLLLILSRAVAREASRRSILSAHAADSEQKGALRRADYLRELATTPRAAKELRVFGLGAWVVRGFDTAWVSAMRGIWAQRGSGRRSLILVLVPTLVADLVVLGLLASSAVGGQISPGQFTTFVLAVLGLGSLPLMSTQDIYAEYGSRPISAAGELEDELRAIDPAPPARPLPPAPALSREIRFEEVSFRYPGTEREVLAGLDLTIPAGGSLGLVGLNGAGKTTLVKLLAGLHRPTSGRITVDGTDLRGADPRSWQSTVAAVFQDFVRFDLSVADNIALGAPALREDRAAIVRAAEQAGLAEAVEGLPHGWDTVLNRLHSKGAELSGGQWQRLALARGLFAVRGGARVLILDEPTASLDVRAEADFFNHLLGLETDPTIILISHRFATVRRADTIAVLEDGRVREHGTHDDLCGRDTRYGSLFRLQAAAFTSPPEGAR
ncbi:ATP-binding cassette subfamily B protein/ATP-binding cassette subfamily C protein [Nocardiopsis sp. Huas11]|uniref:ABC transporter ATP-binding protein n=1 Tax=Nocardiopsis sp. Huas11 TaxID=2183912 RepID=UPI000F2A5C4D|nr:ABC transporter ATP-binding protein [Nocardiopsis sp. Huas11]RKS08427.1 ATP-binding cassette subfamily B protein/ATP-binding cassette subfamily C protein [Nocardiopsis sp. Huas11]